MKKPDDNKLDRLFREGLDKPDGNATFREEDWEAMEELLDQKPKKRDAIFWLYWLSGSIAALLILFFGWALLKPAVIIKNNHQIAKSTIKKSQKINPDYSAEKKESVNTSAKQDVTLTQLPGSKIKNYR
jgi:hypothetical protein